VSPHRCRYCLIWFSGKLTPPPPLFPVHPSLPKASMKSCRLERLLAICRPFLLLGGVFSRKLSMGSSSSSSLPDIHVIFNPPPRVTEVRASAPEQNEFVPSLPTLTTNPLPYSHPSFPLSPTFYFSFHPETHRNPCPLQIH